MRMSVFKHPWKTHVPFNHMQKGLEYKRIQKFKTFSLRSDLELFIGFYITTSELVNEHSGQPE